MPALSLTKPPCFGQTQESIEAWLRANAQPGCQVVIRNTQGGVLSYERATVEAVAKGRIRLDKAGGTGGVSFYFTGKNCFHPKGQTRLVEPTPEVLAACGGLEHFGVGYSSSTV